MNLFAWMGLGLLLGLRHAADPDHVVAVTALASRSRGALSALRLGVVWGLGHMLTLLAVGGGIIVFNWVVPPRVGLTLELIVALVLVTVGLLNLGRRRSAAAPAADGDRRPFFGRAFAVGLAHGLAGSAAVALLVLGTVRDPMWASAYLALFALGTIAGMALVTLGVALPSGLLANRWSGAGRTLRWSSGLVSLGFGAWMVYQVGWRDGLFRAVATWTPH